MLLKSLKYWDRAIGESLEKLSMISFSNNIKNNMEILKMLYFKILKGGLGLSREKWKISTKNLEKYYPFNGEWIAFYSMSSVLSQEYT